MPNLSTDGPQGFDPVPIASDPAGTDVPSETGFA